MMRLRLLAAVLGCLAVLAGGLMAVAAAAAPLASPASEHSTANAPCTHCDECDSAPCPVPAATCMQTAPSGTPTLAAATLDLPAIGFGKIRWALRSTLLSGLSPPPDPFPPRA
ncbi:MAG: hypothetical protein EPO55_17165 [Reyranella sp.]|uniref:hypothetical protein n=1 Tax=Reyranella sp. TaxID=1929291 RepID=UPI0011FC020E|nr:hypothetical protein [Reyranella sp.]TAJ37954.1 MAG: hypothetical protein EPO55_17165 [Reyranella sp.]